MFAVLQAKMDPSPGRGPSPSISPAHHPSLPTPPPLIPLVKTENGRESANSYETAESDHLVQYKYSVPPSDSTMGAVKSEVGSEGIHNALNLYWQRALEEHKPSEKNYDSVNVLENATTSAKSKDVLPGSNSNGSISSWSRTDSAVNSNQTIPQSVSFQHLSMLSQQMLSTVLSLQRLQQSNAPCSLGNLLPPPPDLLMPMKQSSAGPSAISDTYSDTVRDYSSPISIPKAGKSNSSQSYQKNSYSENDGPLDLSLSVAEKSVMQSKHSSPSPTLARDKKYYDESSIASIRSNFPTLLANKAKVVSSQAAPAQTTDKQTKDHSSSFSGPIGSNSDQVRNNSEISVANDQLYSTQIQLQKWLLAAMSVQKMQQIALGRPHLFQDPSLDQDFPKPKRQKMENSMNSTYDNRRDQNPNSNEYRDHQRLPQIPKPPNNHHINTSSRKSLSPASKTSIGIVADANHSQPGKRYRRYAKPPYSYVSLITLSILSSREKKLRLSQILKRISEMFPFFNGAYQGWRDSVRHNLSQNECFVKVLKNPYRPTAKGNFWTVNLSSIPHELLLRQNTLVSRYAQDSGYRYRKDLTEVFDLRTGALKVPVPRHLLKNEDDPKLSMLSDDPAAIMEAILLEDTGEDELNDFGNKITPDVRQFTLEDLFYQCDDNEDDSLLQNGRSRSRNKQVSSTAASPAPRLLPKVFTSRASPVGGQANTGEGGVSATKALNSPEYLPRLLLPKDSRNSHQLSPPFSDTNPFTANQTAVLARALAATQLPGLGLTSFGVDEQPQNRHEMAEAGKNIEKIADSSTHAIGRSLQSVASSFNGNRNSHMTSELTPSTKKSKRKCAQPVRHRDTPDAISSPRVGLNDSADDSFCPPASCAQNSDSCTIVFPSPKGKFCGSASLERIASSDVSRQGYSSDVSSSKV